MTGTPTTLRSTRRQQHEAMKKLLPIIEWWADHKSKSPIEAQKLVELYKDALGTMEMQANMSEVGL